MPNTSIVFGYSSGQWDTTTRSQYRQTANSVKDGSAAENQATVNPETRSVHWNFGIDKTDYSTSNTLPDPRVTGHKPAKLDKNQEVQLRQSHFTLGSDTVDYKWKRGIPVEVMQHATRKQQIENIKYATKKKQVGTGGNIVWGHDKTAQRSEASSNFVDHGFENNSADRERTVKFVEKLKKSTVAFGFNKNEYTTSNSLIKHVNVDRVKPIINPSQSNVVFGYSKLTYQTESKHAM